MFARAALAAAFVVLMSAAAQAEPIRDLQRLLDNAGYNVGGQTGKWTKGTVSALAEFAADYKLDVPDLGKAPDAAAVFDFLSAAKAGLDARHAAFNTTPIPDGYFVGLGDPQYFVIHNWGTDALVLRDGKQANVHTERSYTVLDDDVEKFKAAGIPVMRMQLGMDGALFFTECHYLDGGPSSSFDGCYKDAYGAAKDAKWASQIELLGHFADNPVVQLYVDAAEKWNKLGVHVIVVPTDFYNGRGSSFDGTEDLNADGTPLFHRALMSDPVFQDFYPKFVAAVVAEFKKRDLTNFSVQSANEPRFCNGSNHNQPAKSDLAKWQTLERAEFDAVRRVAPQLSLISTAICTASVSFFDRGRSYSEMGKIMPFHEDLDGVSYAFHLYSPGALFGAGASNDKFKPGTVIHYPYQALPSSAAANEGARDSVKMYNKQKPGPKFFAKIFKDLAAFAKKRGIRLIMTETGIPKPEYGIPREDRLAALGDIVGSSKDAGISMFYFDTSGKWGLASCAVGESHPDHRFDPGMLNIIAWGNGVTGADLAAPLEPIEVQCGKQTSFVTIVQEEVSDPESNAIDVVLATRIDGGPEMSYNIKGSYFPARENFLDFEITLANPSLGEKAPAGVRGCGVQVRNFNGEDHLSMKFKVKDATIRALGADCVGKIVPDNVKAAVELLATQLPDVAAGLIASGNVDAIANKYLPIGSPA